MPVASVRISALLIAALASGCNSRRINNNCSADSDCDIPGGLRCVRQWCAVRADECPTGLRYWDGAGAFPLKGMCVTNDDLRAKRDAGLPRPDSGGTGGTQAHDGGGNNAGSADAAQLDGPRPPDAPRPDGPQPDAPRPDAARPDAPRTIDAPVDASLLANGQDCSTGAQCSSTYCVAGNCCETACNSPCTSCRLVGQPGACGAVQATRTVTAAPVSALDDVPSLQPAIAWSGSEFAVAWANYPPAGSPTPSPTIAAQRLSQGGQRQGTGAAATSTSTHQEIYWLGGQWALAWRESTGTDPGPPLVRRYVVRYQLFTDAQLLPGPSIVVSDELALAGNGRFGNPEPYAEIVWNSTRGEFAAAAPNGGGTDFIRFGREGNRIGTLASQFLPSAYTAGGPAGGYGGIIRAGSGSLEFTQLGPTGEPNGTRVPFLANGVEAPPVGIAIAWSGTEFAAIWFRESYIHMLRMTPSGAPIGSALRVAEAAIDSPIQLHVAWGPGAWIVSWAQGSQASVVLVSSTGRPSVPIILSSTARGPTPRNVAAGEAFGVVWEDVRDGHPEVYFSRLTCN